MGNELNGTLAIGPCCDKNMVRSCSSNPGHTSLDRNCFSRHDAACFCHPMRGWQGSPSSKVPSGRQPSVRSSHDGTSKPAASNASAHLNNDWMEEQFSSPGCLCLTPYWPNGLLAWTSWQTQTASAQRK